MAFIIIVSIYSALIIVLAFGFARLEELPEKTPATIHSISVVVAVRNEGQNIQTLIDSLAKINYPREKWEVILVDDHSTDGSIDKLDVPFRLRKLSSLDSPGKKAAITAGIVIASGDLIVTTDADCRVGERWLQEINKAFQRPGIRMNVGGVRIENTGSFFSRLQAMEFVSVAATGAATLGLGIPTMCNGANLSYQRAAFMEAGGFEGNENISSGDDEFLMNKFNLKWKSCIGFLYSREAVVTTTPSATLSEFVRQRLRWAGKWRNNLSYTTRVFAMVVWLFHVAFVAMPFVAAAGVISWNLFAILAGAKIFVESLFLIPGANFYNVRWSWISFLVLQFIYSFYVISIGLMSQILLPQWKGRAVETKV